MSIPRGISDGRPGLGEWCILSGYRGSIAHGTYVPPKNPLSTDDKDAMAICVPPPQYYLGLREYGSRGTVEIKVNEWDIVVYEIKKMIRLLSQGNPNVLMMLWLEPNHYLCREPAGQLLLSHRSLFVGKHVYRSFVGYAVAQSRKMEQFNKMGYMGAKRKKLVQQYGYDTKNASHLIRLLRMGIEFLNDGEMYVMRHDAPELTAIKQGEWSLDKVKEESERLFQVAEQAYLQSKLPANPDKEKVSTLCEDIIRTAWQDRESDCGECGGPR